MNDKIAEVCKAVCADHTQREIAAGLRMPLGTLTGLVCGYDIIPAWFCVELARLTGDSRPLDVLSDIAGSSRV